MTTQSSHLPPSQYRPDIDGLRAIAVLTVVTFHAFPNFMKGGFIGVDVFFVISGFLISGIIFQNLEKERFIFSEFYSRRIKRIFPALSIVLLTTHLVGWFILLADEYKNLGKNIAAGAAFISNFILWKEAGYFDTSAETKPLLHLWSLGIEEQFYILWPFLAWLAWKKKFNPLIIISTIILASLTLNIYGSRNHSVATFYSPHTRFWELLCGSILAWALIYKKKFWENVESRTEKFFFRSNLYNKIKSDVPALAHIISITGLLLIAIGCWKINKEMNFPGEWAMIPVSGSMLIILAGENAWANRIILSNNIFLWLGKISFPLYLWHWPIFAFANSIYGNLSFTTRTIIIALSVALAWATYRFVEHPIRFGNHRNLKVSFLISPMILAAFIGTLTYLCDGFKFRNFVKQQSFNGIAFDWPENKKKTSECINFIKPYKSDYCVVSEKRPVRIAIIGDSHANALFEFMDSYFSKNEIGVIQLGKGGCPPFLDVERDTSNCPKIMENIASYLKSNDQIKKVFITGRFAATLSGTNFGRSTSEKFYSIKLLSDPTITDRSKIFEIGLRSMVLALLNAKKDITIILDAPELDFHPRTCLNEERDHLCAIEKNAVIKRQLAYRHLIQNVASDYNIRVIDLMDALCHDNYCLGKFDGKILYRDSHHLGLWGSEYLLKNGFAPN